MLLSRQLLQCAPGLSLLVAALVVPLAAEAARRDFVGAEVCGKCHEVAREIWSKSRHARTSESLGRSVTSRRCLGCHSTGEAPAGRPFYSGVQCEACHGPGAGYAEEDVMRDPVLARAMGLRRPGTGAERDTLCLSCHRATTRIAPFDPAKAWERIRHP